MELQFQQTPFSYLQCVLRKCGTQEESTEVIVPDRLPDVMRVLNTNTCVCMREKECRQGTASVSGGVRVVALYVGESTNAPQKLEAYLPFSVRADNADITENSDILFSASVGAVETKVVNSRKIAIRVSIVYSLLVYSLASDDLFSCEEQIEGLQTKETTYSLLLPTAYAERSFGVADGLVLPALETANDAVLFVNAVPEVSEKRLAGNKAVFKGTVDCTVSYLADDGRFCTQSLQIPFSQFCELPETFDETAVLTVAAQISDCSWEASSTPSALEINADLTVQCLVLKPVTIALTDDAYCVNKQFEPKWKQYSFDTRLDLQSQTDAVRAFTEADVREVLDASVTVGAPTVEREGGLATVRVLSVAEVLYRDESNQLQCGKIRNESVFTCELCADADIKPEAMLCGGVSAVPTANGLEVRYSVCLVCDSSARWIQNTIIGGEISERAAAENRPQLIAKRVDGRQELWDIAKAYSTTIERIQSVNHLDEKWFADGVLLIPTEGM